MNTTGTNAWIGDSRPELPSDPSSMTVQEYDPFSVNQIFSVPQILHQHSPEEWELRRPEITRLYVDERLPLQHVITAMGFEYGFFGT
jgi:hypothetical protein